MPYQGEYAQAGKQWKVGMFETPCASPLKFCGYCLCAPCGAYYQREKLLADPNAPYFCCMGTFPICCLASPCPRVPCLCLEVVCCLSCAVVSNRAYIQGTRHVRNTDCDNCIIWCTCCLQCTICIAQVLGYRVDPSVKNAVDLLYCTVLGCMQTQQDLEVDDTFYGPPDQSMK